MAKNNLIRDNMKVCSRCHIEKPIGEFRESNNCKDGLMGWCRCCERQYYIDYRVKHSESIKEKGRKRREENKEKTSIARKARYKENPEKYRSRANAFRLNNPERVQVYNHAHYLNNRYAVMEASAKWAKDNAEQRRVAANIWRANNKDKIKKSAKKTYKKLSSNPQHRLDRGMSRGMSHTLHEGKKAGRHWETLVPYTIEQLKAHLKKQFTKEMTWGNYGTYWHIDHKIPKSIFNYSSPEHIDFQRCWALKNLQPLEAKTNLIKHNKIESQFQPSLALAL